MTPTYGSRTSICIYLKASPLPPAPAEAQRFGSSEALGLGGSEAWGLGVLQEQVLGALDVF